MCAGNAADTYNFIHVQYMNGGKSMIVSERNIGGRSPDYADALMMRMWLS